jgi:hypothetical protein
MKRIAFAFVLTLVMIATAAAQRPAYRLNDEDLRPIIHYTSAIEGIEVSPGFVSEKNDVRTGTTYALDVSGTLAGHFTAVFDSTTPAPDPANGNQILRGTWTMAVYKDGTYQGMLFGEITGGEMIWKGDGDVMLFGIIRAQLTIKGGTKGMIIGANRYSFGAFDVTWEGSPKGSALPALNGKLELSF